MTIPAKLLLPLAVLLAGCGKDDGVNEAIPYAPVNLQLNLTNIEYHGLSVAPGIVEIEGGVRGIILAKRGPNQYLAFEKNCPYRPYDSCATVTLDPSKLFLADPCCHSQFNFDGELVSGPSQRPLLKYSTSLAGNGSLLYITN